MKRKFKMTLNFIWKIAAVLMLGMFAFMAGYCDINWKIASIFLGIGALYIGVFAGINFLLLKKWGRFLLWGLAIIFCMGLLALLIIALLAGSDNNVYRAILDRILTSSATFKSARFAIFVTLFSLFAGQLILGCLWKPARRWGLLVFYFTLGSIIAVVGQVIDYVTARDTAMHASSVSGMKFGDYGLRDSYYDQAESYNTNEEKNKTRPGDYRAVTKYGIGVSGRDRFESYYNNKGE